MKGVKVPGAGCANCKTTLKLIEEAAPANGLAIKLEKIEGMATLLGYGVMSAPGAVIDDTVVHMGGVPDRRKIEGWLT